MTRTYAVRPDRCFDVWFSLHVSSTRKEMNRHIEAYAKSTWNVVEHEPLTAGLCQATAIREFPPEGKRRWYSDQFATVFLNDEDLKKNGTEIVPHEALHCALAHERFVMHYSMDYSSCDDMEHEERLCYTHGRIVVGIYKALRGKK
jgi:hypothetical protein